MRSSEIKYKWPTGAPLPDVRDAFPLAQGPLRSGAKQHFLLVIAPYSRASARHEQNGQAELMVLAGVSVKSTSL